MPDESWLPYKYGHTDGVNYFTFEGLVIRSKHIIFFRITASTSVLLITEAEEAVK